MSIQDLHYIAINTNIVHIRIRPRHIDSYHAHFHDKQTITTILCIKTIRIIHLITPSQNFLRRYLCNVYMGSLLPSILSNLPQVILIRVLVIYFHCAFYFRETIVLIDPKIMSANIKFGVIETYTKWKVFLPSEGRPLKHVSILIDITFLYPIGKAQFIELGAVMETSTLHPLLGHESIHPVRTVVDPAFPRC